MSDSAADKIEIERINPLQSCRMLQLRGEARNARRHLTSRTKRTCKRSGLSQEANMAWWAGLERFPFGDGPELADELLALILLGRKTATCWSATEGEKGTKVGKQWVVLDGAGRPRAVLETVELAQRRFHEVDAAFAFEEGEDDRTLAAWRAAHEEYFGRNKCFAPDMLLYCERFRLIEILDVDG